MIDLVIGLIQMKQKKENTLTYSLFYFRLRPVGTDLILNFGITVYHQ